jgi:hypothetical protein
LRGNANDSYYPYNISIIGNTFYNNKDFSGVDPGGTAMIYTGGSPLTGCILRNNVFINPHSYGTVALSGTGWQIENNTVYNGGYFRLPNGGLTSFRNNILTGWATLYYRLEPSLSGTIISFR